MIRSYLKGKHLPLMFHYGNFHNYWQNILSECGLSPLRSLFRRVFSFTLLFLKWISETSVLKVCFLSGLILQDSALCILIFSPNCTKLYYSLSSKCNKLQNFTFSLLSLLWTYYYKTKRCINIQLNKIDTGKLEYGKMPFSVVLRQVRK